MTSVALLCASAGLAVGLSGCGGDNGLSLVRQGCTHVDRSIRLFRDSQAEHDPARAAAERNDAEGQLRVALQSVALAAGQNSQWQALMATLSEGNQVSEAELVPALEQQCAVAQGTGQGSGGSP